MKGLNAGGQMQAIHDFKERIRIYEEAVAAAPELYKRAP